VAGTHRPNGATAAINPGGSRSPLNAVGGWKLGLLITDFARFINSEIARLCAWPGAATEGALLVGSGGTHEEIARPFEGGFIGRARCVFIPTARPSISAPAETPSAASTDGSANGCLLTIAHRSGGPAAAAGGGVRRQRGRLL
jgi:hypothetical protein